MDEMIPMHGRYSTTAGVPVTPDLTLDLRECNRDSAVQVMKVPEEFSHPAMCAMHAQASLAEMSIGQDLYNTRDALPRCGSNDPGEGTTCWPAPESTDNMDTKRVGHLGLSDEDEDALVNFMQTLTDGYMQRDQK
jgi:hypothetical protein